MTPCDMFLEDSMLKAWLTLAGWNYMVSVRGSVVMVTLVRFLEVCQSTCILLWNQWASHNSSQSRSGLGYLSDLNSLDQIHPGSDWPVSESLKFPSKAWMCTPSSNFEGLCRCFFHVIVYSLHTFDTTADYFQKHAGTLPNFAVGFLQTFQARTVLN